MTTTTPTTFVFRAERVTRPHVTIRTLAVTADTEDEAAGQAFQLVAQDFGGRAEDYALVSVYDHH